MDDFDGLGPDSTSSVATIPKPVASNDEFAGLEPGRRPLQVSTPMDKTTSSDFDGLGPEEYHSINLVNVSYSNGSKLPFWRCGKRC